MKLCKSSLITILLALYILITLKSQVSLDSNFFKEREITHIKIDENNMLRFSEYLIKKDLIPLHYTYNDCSYNHILNNIFQEKNILRNKRRNALGWGAVAVVFATSGFLYQEKEFLDFTGPFLVFIGSLSATISFIPLTKSFISQHRLGKKVEIAKKFKALNF